MHITFTIVLIVVVVTLIVAVVIHEIVTWNKPGHEIKLNAPMDSSAVNSARFQNQVNNGGAGGAGGFGGSPF